MEGENRNGGGGVRPLLLVLLPAIFFALFLSSFKGFRSPILIKSGWDALNFLLVLLAILCGLFGRNNNEDEPAPDKSPAPTTSPLTDHHSQARSEVDSRTVGMRRMRSSSSYPDLRQEAWWGPPDTDTWRFSDDIQLYRTNQPRSDHQYRYRYEEPSENPIPHPTSPVKTIPVDTLEIRKSPPPPPSPPPPERFRTPPPPPSPPPPMTRKPRRRTVKKVAPAEEPDVLPEPLPSPPLPEPENPDPSPEPTRRPPPPPPPPPPPMSPMHVTIKRMEGKKSSGAKDIAAALAQFYQKKKKRSKVKKIYDDDESVTETRTVPPSTPPPPPPPPPPPASSMFQQLFKKSGSKSSKRHHHHSFPPPPPPPPPPAKKKESAPAPAPIPTPLLPQNLVHKRRHKPRSSQSSYPLPPSPLRPSEDLYRKIERISPSTPYYSIPMPPPPPPPPPSNESEESNVKENGIKEEEEEQQQFCPSPDVNNKAETFIARFRAGLKLEKLNSIKLREQQQQQQQQQQQEEDITTAT